MSLLNVGVVGCGSIAQVIHIPNLIRLNDRFRIGGFCDIRPEALDLVVAAYPGPRCYDAVEDLVAIEELDALIVLTTGNHLGEIRCAAEAGLHVFTEKPLCLTPAEADDAVAAVERAGVTAAVGYMKRFSPGTRRAAELLSHVGRLSIVQCELWHPPQEQYLDAYGVRTLPPGEGEDFVEAMRRLVTTGNIGRALDETLDTATLDQRVAYFLLVTVGIHDLNLLRALLGEPTAITFSATWDGGLSGSVQLAFPTEVRANFAWAFPAAGSYHEELRLVGAAGRLLVRYPPPYQPLMPVELEWEEPGPGRGLTTHLTTAGWHDPFKLELVAFHECVTRGTAPLNSFRDALADLTLIRQIALAAENVSADLTGVAVAQPGSEFETEA